jgi:hypothetical protein
MDTDAWLGFDFAIVVGDSVWESNEAPDGLS